MICIVSHHHHVKTYYLHLVDSLSLKHLLKMFTIWIALYMNMLSTCVKCRRGTKMAEVTHKDRLRKCYKLLVDDLDYESIKDALYTRGIITRMQRNKINQALTSSDDKVRALIDILERGSREKYLVFCEILFEEQEHLWHALEGESGNGVYKHSNEHWIFV